MKRRHSLYWLAVILSAYNPARCCGEEASLGAAATDASGERSKSGARDSRPKSRVAVVPSGIAQLDDWAQRWSPTYERVSRPLRHSPGIESAAAKEIKSTLLPKSKQPVDASEAASVMILRIVHESQEGKRGAIDIAASQKEVWSSGEFAILHIMVDLDCLRLHRQILYEIDTRAGPLPPRMWQWINPRVESLRDYNVPFAYDWMKEARADGTFGKLQERFGNLFHRK